MLSEKTINAIKKGSEKQRKEMLRKVDKINNSGGVAKFQNNPNSVVLIKCPVCKQEQSEFRIKTPTGGCEHCDF